jgi:hypothetical protein
MVIPRQPGPAIVMGAVGRARLMRQGAGGDQGEPKGGDQQSVQAHGGIL